MEKLGKEPENQKALISICSQWVWWGVGEIDRMGMDTNTPVWVAWKKEDTGDTDAWTKIHDRVGEG